MAAIRWQSFQALARHRHQKLHRHLRRDLALAHLLLDRFRQGNSTNASRRDTQLTLRSKRRANSSRP
jgi:hypothetical protein